MKASIQCASSIHSMIEAAQGDEDGGEASGQYRSAYKERTRSEKIVGPGGKEGKDAKQEEEGEEEEVVVVGLWAQSKAVEGKGGRRAPKPSPITQVETRSGGGATSDSGEATADRAAAAAVVVVVSARQPSRIYLLSPLSLFLLPSSGRASALQIEFARCQEPGLWAGGVVEEERCGNRISALAIGLNLVDRREGGASERRIKGGHQRKGQ
ncbi:hypothetical protein AXG93_868s1410 [Marchantia polymorpha subsp. ruderalis]|uniref:Uncharacterized protein n=1 Tax=Marchantia polymorpha subsp. ruderalis TaxID=1480154 RepID=A0A176VLM6_MARPO|nr:hypothetical protein AXG93_868s1410 [Marchantia polymorpha subsp. ruderalis]